MQWIILGLIIFAVGCGVAHQQRRKPPTFAVELDSPLYDDAIAAAAEWSAMTGLDVQVSPDGDIPIFEVAKLDVEACGPNAWGCSYRGEGIQVLEGMPSEWRKIIIMHEMGHHFRGEKGHVTTNEMAIMADPIKGKVLTIDDAQFICAKLGCSV